MTALSRTLEKEILEIALGKKKPSEGVETTTTWVGLSTNAAEPEGTGETAVGTEASYEGYARVEVKPTAWEAPTNATPSIVKNEAEIKFPEAGASSASNKVLYFFISRSSSSKKAADLLTWGKLEKEKTIEAESTPSFKAKTLEFSIK